MPVHRRGRRLEQWFYGSWEDREAFGRAKLTKERLPPAVVVIVLLVVVPLAVLSTAGAFTPGPIVVWLALVAAVLFRGLATRQRGRLRRGETGVAAHSTTVITLAMPMQEADSACQRAIATLPHWTVDPRPAEPGVLRARVGGGIRSFGENVEVRLAAMAGNTQVTITSSSVVPTTAFDFGKNRANVEALAAKLEAFRG